MNFTVVALNVGRRSLIGQDANGADVYSAIRKAAIADGVAEATALGLVGDEQVDQRVLNGRRVHGGPEKALYGFPEEHFDAWRRELGVLIGPASFGENLTLRGVTEDRVYVGDEFRCGSVLLKVTKPRRPCYKLPIHLGVPDVSRRMIRNGLCGFYFAVPEPGEIHVGDIFELVARYAGAKTIAQTFSAKTAVDPSIPGPS